MPTCKTISVVICTHDASRFPRLRQALASLAAQTLPAAQTILVVDANEALLSKAQAAFPSVQVLSNTARPGLSGARNTGVLASWGDIVAFLDDDAIADPSWLEALAGRFEDQFTMGAGGPIVPLWPQERPGWFPPEFDWVVGCSYAGQAAAAGEVRNLIGCNMAFRRNALLLCGLFAEDLGRVGGNAAGAEETELCLRAAALFPSARLVLEDRASVRHQIEPQRTGFGYFLKRCLAEGRSKALMSRQHRSGAGLSSERRHLFSVLPKSILAHLATGLFGRDGHGFTRAGAIMAGTMAAMAGFAWGRLRGKAPPPPARDFLPRRVCEIDLAAPPQPIAGSDGATGTAFAAAHCVVRHATRLVAVMEVPLYGQDLPAAAVAALFSSYAPLEPPRPANLQLARTRVVVATRDRTEMLRRCLDSLLAQDHPDFEIVVVDNAPATTATRELVQQVYGGRVRYLCEPRAGLANAHNRGLEGLDAQIVAFTDDDVRADRHWLSTLVAPLVEDSAVGCVTGGIVPAELDTRAQYWTERHGGFLKSSSRLEFDLGPNRPGDALFPYAAGRFGSGANMAFSRPALEAIGGFDPILGAGTPARGGDDLAAFTRVILAGFRLVYMPDALVWHYHRRGEDGMQRQAYGYGVGLGAFLTGCLVEQPVRLVHFALAAPAALLHLFAPRSGKNVRLPPDYPRAFVLGERLGVLAGVPAYFSSRRVAGKARAAAAPLSPAPFWKGN